MAITAKPQPTLIKAVDFIAAGGSAPASTVVSIANRQEHHKLLLRFSDNALLQRLDRARAKGSVKLPRNTWILLAIANQLDAEGY